MFCWAVAETASVWPQPRQFKLHSVGQVPFIRYGFRKKSDWVTVSEVSG